jgi:hypothetical protein
MKKLSVLHAVLSRLSVCEIDIRKGAFGIVFHLEELFVLQFKPSGNQIRRKGLHPGVVIADSTIVITAGLLQGVFNLREFLLQVQKVGVSSQLRIVFGHAEQVMECTGQCVFVALLVVNRPIAHRPGSQTGYIINRTAFEISITLNCLDKNGNQVVAAF